MTQARQPIRTRSVAALGGALVAIFLGLLALGVVPRVEQQRALAIAAENAGKAAQRVYIVRPKAATGADLSLAATTQPFRDAVVYARTNGYVTRRYVDIGDKVKAGQVLAEIASPEIDQQLKQGQAELKQARKNLDLQATSLSLARVTQERYRAADSGRAVAKQAVDQSVAAAQTAEASVAAAEANVESQLANVQRLQELTGFEKIVAPFAGTIIRRNVDVGALITAGSPTSSGPAAGGGATGLFEVADIDTLRVFVNVPQVQAPNVEVGLPVKVTARGHLDKAVEGTVTRTANALDPVARTLLVEIDLPNATHALMPGMFANVGVKLTPSGTHWNVPATAVVVDSEGTRVVMVGPDNKLHFQPVVLGRDFGDAIDIQSGLDGHESIVRQPRVSLEEGQVVEPLPAPQFKG